MRILLFLLLMAPSAFASEKYIVEKPDGSVAVIEYIASSSDSLGDVLDELGLTGQTIKAVAPGDLPNDRVDRKYWRLNDVPVGPKITIDGVAKANDAAAEAAKQGKKNAALAKLGITAEELKDLLYGE